MGGRAFSRPLLPGGDARRSIAKDCVNPGKRWYHQYQHRFPIIEMTAILHSN
jgi:hypothetical protein